METTNWPEYFFRLRKGGNSIRISGSAAIEIIQSLMADNRLRRIIPICPMRANDTVLDTLQKRGDEDIVLSSEFRGEIFKAVAEATQVDRYAAPWDLYIYFV